jgi:hypothetical protein
VLSSTASGQLENTNDDDDDDDNSTMYLFTWLLSNPKANYKVSKCKEINKTNKDTRTKKKQSNLYHLATVHFVQSY